MPRLCTKIVAHVRFPNHGIAAVRVPREEWHEVTRRWLPIAPMIVPPGGSIPGTLLDNTPTEIIIALEGEVRIRLPKTHFKMPKDH